METTDIEKIVLELTGETELSSVSESNLESLEIDVMTLAREIPSSDDEVFFTALESAGFGDTASLLKEISKTVIAYDWCSENT
jgi:hypothetical protein